jgi:hypothetical protein
MMRAVLLFGWAAAQDHDHHHAHGHGAMSCGCEKDEKDHPFKMDCTDKAAIKKAGEDMKACGDTASQAACKDLLETDNTCVTAFFILQSHHDYCDHETLTAEEEELVHIWEGSCIQCQVFRGHDKDLDTCPMVDCKKPQPATDATKTLTDTCTKESAEGAGDGKCCADAATTKAFQTIIAYHDLCAHDDIPKGVEDAVHDYEHSCEAHMCNVVKEGYDGTVCKEKYADDFLLGIGWVPKEDVTDIKGDSAAGVLGLLSAALLWA